MVKKIAAKDYFSNFVAMKIAGLKITKNKKIPEILAISTRFFLLRAVVVLCCCAAVPALCVHKSVVDNVMS